MFKETWKIFVGVCLFVHANGQSGSPCTTPNQEQADCRPLQRCQVLVNALYDRDARDFLRQSQCGFRNNAPLVCCGTYANFVDYSGGEVNDGQSERIQDTSVLPPRSVCGRQATSQRILNGEQTDLDEFPWMALLAYRRNGQNRGFACGGALISPRYVLTAAHCVTGAITRAVGQLTSVRLGEYNTDTDQDCTSRGCAPAPLDIGVEQRIPHPDYDDSSRNRYNDIALVRLNADVPYSNYVRPICLPTTSADVAQIGERVSVAGWGRTEKNRNSPVKLKLRVPVANQDTCAQTFMRARVTLRSDQICAGGERGKDSCRGDSGGPLMKSIREDGELWYAEGIVSFGAECGTEGWPGIYTRVSSHMDWILSNMRN